MITRLRQTFFILLPLLLSNISLSQSIDSILNSCGYQDKIGIVDTMSMSEDDLDELIESSKCILKACDVWEEYLEDYIYQSDSVRKLAIWTGLNSTDFGIKKECPPRRSRETKSKKCKTLLELEAQYQNLSDNDGRPPLKDECKTAHTNLLNAI